MEVVHSGDATLSANCINDGACVGPNESWMKWINGQ